MSAMNLAPVPPQDLDAEECVIGAMLLSGHAIDAAREIIVASDFYRHSHGVIFTAALRLHDRSEPVDAITVHDELDREDELEAAGGREHVHELAATVPDTARAGFWARIVREMSTLRELTTIGEQIQRLGWERPGPTVDLVMRAEELVATLATKGRKDEKRIRLYDALVAFDARMRSPVPEALGVPAPFSFLGALQASRLYVLGAYQKDGKTVTAAQFVRSAAEARKRVGFVSIEMGWRDLTDRFVSSMGVPYYRVQSGDLGVFQPAAEAAIRTMAGWDVDIIDDSDVNVASLRAYQRSYAYDLLIIDHLHRIDWTDRRDLERTLRGITNIARDFEVPVLLLAQLSRSRRDGLKSAFPRPTMASLRESGMIEAEAAAVWFVWRRRDDNDLPMDETEFIIAANRFGETGVRELFFNRGQVHFTETR